MDNRTVRVFRTRHASSRANACDRSEELIALGGRSPEPEAAATYDAAAERYEGALSVNASAARRLVAALPRRPVDTVVDLGCGTGFASLAAVDLLAPRDIVGVDASAEMLARYRERLEQARAHVRPIQASIESVPLPDGVADLVLATMALQWIDDRAPAIAEAARLLGDGGWLGVVVPAKGADREFHEVLRALDPLPPALWLAVEQSRTVSGDALVALLESAGFTIADRWIEERSRTVPVGDLLERMMLVGAHVFPVPADDPRIWERVGIALEHRAGPAGFAYTFRKLFVIARRTASVGEG